MDIRQTFLSAFILLSVSAMAAPGNEARLLRFPATNGTDIAFTYAGDLYTVPVSGGERYKNFDEEGFPS